MTTDITTLSDAGLISVIIGKNETLSKELLSQFSNDLAEMARDLVTVRVKGLGEAKLSLLKCAFELGRRKERQEEINRLNAYNITCSECIFAQFNHELSDLDHEELWALYLSRSGKLLKKVRISSGGVDFAGADVRMIVKPAVNLNASNVALAHNHPHSATRPSNADREITKQVQQALSLFDIRLVDHLIISDGRYYSFKDNGDI